MNIYKIRRKSDKLYSNGGIYSDFNNDGKSWTLKRLKLYIAMFKIPKYYRDIGETKEKYDFPKNYNNINDLEVVVFEEKEIIDFKKFIGEI